MTSPAAASCRQAASWPTRKPSAGDDGGAEPEPQRRQVVMPRRDERACSATLASTSSPVFSQTIRGTGIARQSENSIRIT